MSDVHVLRRALRWDLTTPSFSSRAAVAEMKIRMDENTRVPEVISHWRSLTTGGFITIKHAIPFYGIFIGNIFNESILGAETCLFALRQYETRSCLFARQYEEHIDLLNVKCRTGTHGQCSKCQLKNSISDFINSCKRYQHETPSYEHFKSE